MDRFSSLFLLLWLFQGGFGVLAAASLLRVGSVLQLKRLVERRLLMNCSPCRLPARSKVKLFRWFDCIDFDFLKLFKFFHSRILDQVLLFDLLEYLCHWLDELVLPYSAINSFIKAQLTVFLLRLCKFLLPFSRAHLLEDVIVDNLFSSCPPDD